MEQEAAAHIAELMSRTNRLIRRAAEQELAPLGVTPGQLRALRVLGQGPMRISALAKRLDVVPRSATSVVDELESAGLVRRLPDPNDRRATLVEMTDAGRQVLAELRARRHAGMAELLGRLSGGGGRGGGGGPRPPPRARRRLGRPHRGIVPAGLSG